MAKKFTEKQRQELRKDMVRQGYQIGSVDQTWGKIGEALYWDFKQNRPGEVALIRTGEVAYESFSIPFMDRIPLFNGYKLIGILDGLESLKSLDREEVVKRYSESRLPDSVRAVRSFEAPLNGPYAVFFKWNSGLKN